MCSPDATDRELLEKLDQTAAWKRSHVLVLSPHPALHQRWQLRKRQYAPTPALGYAPSLSIAASSSSSGSASSSGNSTRKGDGILDVYSFISPMLIVSLLLIFAFLVPLIVFGISQLAAIPLPHGLEHKFQGTLSGGAKKDE